MQDELATRDRSTGALPPFLGTPLGVAAVVLAFGVVYSTIRILASSAIGTDDAWENVYAQALRPGYILAQPPLYEWILWTAQQALGTGVRSFLVVKFLLMTLSALFLFGAARSCIRDPAISALATFSYVLFYQIGWNMLEGVTHTAVLVCACTATAFTLARAVTRGHLLDYLFLGLALGAGLLSKFGFPLFAGSLLAAFLTEPLLRRRIRPAGLVMAALVALLVASPFLYWVVAGERPVLGTVTSIMTEGARDPHLVRAASGVGRLVLSLAGFAVPLVPLVLLLFWRPILRRVPGDDAYSNAIASAYGKTVLISIAVALVAIVATGSSRLRERHMHPFLLLLPIWLFARIERGGAPVRRLRMFRAVMVAAVGLVLAIRVASFVAPDTTFCGKACRVSKPYHALVDQLGAMGAGGTLVGIDRYTAGNLRAGFPAARILMATEPLGFPAPRSPPSPCWVVWEDDGKGEPDFEKAARQEGLDPADWPPLEPDRRIVGHWDHLWKPPGFRLTIWGVRRADPSARGCSGGDLRQAPAGEEVVGGSSFQDSRDIARNAGT